MVSATPQAAARDLSAGSAPFLDWLQAWAEGLQPLDLAAYMETKGKSPEQVALISADLVVGFCYEGLLASPRIADVVEPSAELFRRAYNLGVRDFVLVQEHHTHEAVEFEQFGPHCVRGTQEAETVAALADLPFANLYKKFLKNSLHPAIGTGLDEWVASNPRLDTFIVVGDCTDLCLYQLAMHLKLTANVADRRIDVIVPANCVQTYDLPLQVAEKIGAMPHDGDLLHAIFLYHMALNGATVVSGVA